MEGALASVVEAMAPYAASPAESRDQEVCDSLCRLTRPNASERDRFARLAGRVRSQTVTDMPAPTRSLR